MLKPDGQLVLIDFGAVRKISPTFLAKIGSEKEITQIGSAGYIPIEQINGKSVPQSDFFALGRTMIHLITGIHPIQLEENPETYQLIWRDDLAEEWKTLADLIDWLMEPLMGKRPQNAEVILQVIANFKEQGLIKDIKPPESLLGKLLAPLLSLLVVTGLGMGGRELKFLETWEAQVFDSLIRLKPAEKPDERILIIEATDNDIKTYGYPIPDQILGELFTKLMSFQPRVIGLYLFRDVPVGASSKLLNSHWRENQKLIVPCFVDYPQLPNRQGTAPPASVPESRIGFTDFIKDKDNVFRRQLISQNLFSQGLCQTETAFSFLVAQSYLKPQGIVAHKNNLGYWQLGRAVLKPIDVYKGFYRQRNYTGYQIFINYRAAHPVAQKVTLSEVMNGRIPSNLIKNRLVLVTTNTSTTKRYITPYRHELSAVEIQAQMTSQLLSSALGESPLLTALPEWAEYIWVWSWFAVAWVVAINCRWGRIKFILSFLGIGIILYATSYILILNGLLMPFIPAILGVVGAGVTVYRQQLKPYFVWN